MKPLLWPYLVGSTLFAVVIAIAAYQLALAFVTNLRVQKIIHRHD